MMTVAVASSANAGSRLSASAANAAAIIATPVQRETSPSQTGAPWCATAAGSLPA